jgi:hypothetical protein
LKIFLSWSGTLSREVAGVFAKYLPLSSSFFEVWFDQQSIKQGMRWESQIRDALQQCDAVLIFLTDNNSQWMLFEAGVAHSLGKLIIPITVGVKLSSLSGPLAQFQAVDIASYSSVNKLIVSLVKNGNIAEGEQLLAQQRWEMSFPSFCAEIDKVLKMEESEKLVRDGDKARATDAFDKAWKKK